MQKLLYILLKKSQILTVKIYFLKSQFQNCWLRFYFYFLKPRQQNIFKRAVIYFTWLARLFNCLLFQPSTCLDHFFLQSESIECDSILISTYFFLIKVYFKWIFAIYGHWNWQTKEEFSFHSWFHFTFYFLTRFMFFA